MTDTYNPAGNGKQRKSKAASAPAIEPVVAPAAMPAAPAVDDGDPVARRIEELRARRKERASVDVSGLNQKLSVPEAMKDPRFTYRWVKDVNTRHYEMKRKDWEYVEDANIAQDERNSGIGTRIERVGDERTTPKPVKTFLMRKPKEFYEEDKAIQQKSLKAQEQAIVRGEARNEQGQSEPGMYVPAGGMKIESGR